MNKYTMRALSILLINVVVAIVILLVVSLVAGIRELVAWLV